MNVPVSETEQRPRHRRTAISLMETLADHLVVGHACNAASRVQPFDVRFAPTWRSLSVPGSDAVLPRNPRIRRGSQDQIAPDGSADCSGSEG